MRVDLNGIVEITSDRRQAARTPAVASYPSQEECDVSGAWDSDNQAWWDWYVGLAHNKPPAESKGRNRDAASGAASPEDIKLEPDPCAVAPLGFDDLKDELATPYPLPPNAAEQFRLEGYVKLPGVLSSGAVFAMRREIVAVLEATFDAMLDGGAPARRGEESSPEAGRRFYSAEMAWLENPVIRLFVLSPRIAKICADLLGIESVRLYHDNLLSKEPGCGRTPWHYDDHHFPLATNDVVTAWIAAQAIPQAMGPLAFAKGIETWRLVADIPFSKADTSYDRRVAERFRELDVNVDDAPFAVGDVSFHHNLSFHTAGGNETPFSRCVLANTYYADGARLVDAPTMVSGDWRKFLPGVEPGDVAASRLNPVCWPPDERWSRAIETEQSGGPDGG